ncbi:MAG TPA: hypothetical protein VGG08_02435, partial [Solirubrobacteraceae bacterium]
HEISEPVEVGKGYYFLVYVYDTAPGYVERFARVRHTIEKELVSEQRARALARFVVRWRRWWSERTICNRGYVAPGCHEYHGSLFTEVPRELG